MSTLCFYLGLDNDKSRLQKIALVKPHVRKNSLRATHHEVRQRIATDFDACNHYQQHWFSAGLEVSNVLKQNLGLISIWHPTWGWLRRHKINKIFFIDIRL